MRYMLVLIVLACAMPVTAGEIVIGFCGECTYQTDEFFAGYGMIPGYVAEVYRDPDSGEFHLVRFDIIEIVAEEIAVHITNNHVEIDELNIEEIAINITNNHLGIGMETARAIAVTINNNYREIAEISFSESAVIINNSYEDVVEISMAWSSPEVLGNISLDEVLPAGVHIIDEPAGDPMCWEIVSLDEVNLCPVCCGETLEFQRVGNWD